MASYFPHRNFITHEYFITRNYNIDDHIAATKFLNPFFVLFQMSSVDPEGALAMYSGSGDWEKCLELAEKQGGAVLDKYIALYAAELIKTNAPLSALKLFAKHGAPPNPQVD